MEKQKRARDSRRSRVLKAEKLFFTFMPQPELGWKEVSALKERVLSEPKYHHNVVKIRTSWRRQNQGYFACPILSLRDWWRSYPRGYGVGEPMVEKRWNLLIPCGHRNAITILHGMAMITVPEDKAWHGTHWIKEYLRLLRQYVGEAEAKVMEQFLDNFKARRASVVF